MRSVLRDTSLSTVTAGFIAVLVGFTSSIAVVFQAAKGLGATPAEISSWVWALGIGMGLCTLVPSLWLRKPVMVAWSTPGAAVLATAGVSGGFTLAEATGAFLVSAALITLFGVTGWFERLMDRIPMPIANALFAGVLAHFAMEAFLALGSDFNLVALMFVTYLAGRRLWPRYTVPGVLAVGCLFAAGTGQWHSPSIPLTLTTPVFIKPVFTVAAVVSLALPLFVVTMASQNLPGVVAIRAAGYDMPISKIITLTGVANFVLAPVGAFALNLAAITAAICMGKEAHEDPKRRYTAAMACGVFYIFVGLFGGAVVAVLSAFPHAMVVALAGFALLGSIGAGIAGAVHDGSHREAAIITFLVTLSGVSLWGVGSAFWGVVAGALAYLAVPRPAIAAK